LFFVLCSFFLFSPYQSIRSSFVIPFLTQEQYIITSKTGEDLLADDRNALKEVFELFDRVQNFEIPDRNTGERYNLGQLCLKPLPIACLEYGPLDYWDKDLQKMEMDEDLHQTVQDDEFNSSLGPLNRSLVSFLFSFFQKVC